MPVQRELMAFYEAAYSGEGAQALLYARWRALGAVGKADHVISLCARAGVRPASTLDVGCGDGALLSELHSRDFGGRLHGVEISERAVEIAAGRAGIDSVELCDGEHLSGADGEHDLGLVSHVLEHVPDPGVLLAEVARVCRAVVVEVPLEQNLSARRSSKREQAEAIGHLDRLSRASMRAIVARSDLRIAAELQDPLPLTVHTFFAKDRRTRAAAGLRWLTRAALHRGAPALARRLFTVHYACLCLPNTMGVDDREPVQARGGDGRP
jgi:SAM-dependent methyltransferase